MYACMISVAVTNVNVGMLDRTSSSAVCTSGCM